MIGNQCVNLCCTIKHAKSLIGYCKSNIDAAYIKPLLRTLIWCSLMHILTWKTSLPYLVISVLPLVHVYPEINSQLVWLRFCVCVCPALPAEITTFCKRSDCNATQFSPWWADKKNALPIRSAAVQLHLIFRCLKSLLLYEALACPVNKKNPIQKHPK